MLERVWRKGNPLALLVGMQTSTATMENSVEILKKLEIELPYDSAIPQLGIHTKGTKTERDMYPSVHCNTIHNSWDMEATLMSIGRRMDKKAVVHIHNGVLLRH